MSDLYKRIETLCETQKINVTEMCRQSGAPRGSLTDLKNGRTTELTTKTLTKIATYFGVSVGYLLGTEEEKKPLVNDDEELQEYLEILRTRPECRILFSLTKDASKEDVEKAVAIIEALRKTEGRE